MSQSEYERLIAPIEEKMMRAVWQVTQDRHDAEEAFQEALGVIWRRFEHVCKHPNPHALILRICINAGYDTVRRNARRRTKEAKAQYGEPLHTRGADVLLELAEKRSAITKAIGQLSRNQAAAVVMRLIQGEDFEAIAQVLGCKCSTVRKHLERGRARLRELLRPWSSATDEVIPNE